MLGIMALNTVKLWKPWTLELFLDCYYVGKENQSDTRNLWFALISHLIGRSWHSEHFKIILTVHGFISHMLIIALRNNTVCFGVFMPGSPQTEPAWLSRPVWLIGLLRSSNTGNIFVQPSSQQCCVASWDCLLHVLPPLHITNFHVAKSRSNKFVVQKGVNMCKKQSQLATKHCCTRSFTKMLLVLLGLKRPMSQTGLVSHAGSVCRDPGINTPHTLCSYIRKS